MPVFEIICLANSDKRGGRCVAGLKTDGSGWLRPVSRQPGGILQPEHYLLDIDCEPQLFDILELDCAAHRPECHQPENWLIQPKQWRFVGFPDLPQLNEILKPELEKSAALSTLFGNLGDRVDYPSLQKNPTAYSLLYLKPEKVQWVVQDYIIHKKYRAIFFSNLVQYNFPITDPIWKAQMDQAKLPEGQYSSAQIIDKLGLSDFTDDGFRFTMSLGEPFAPTGEGKQYCFKVIAAVMNTSQVIQRLTQRAGRSLPFMK
ncbi:MAG: hypothetical protein MUF49_13290 [Oculatellaceae cyanobacterium Prado106]|jgi:hypothetical protein|nr:hypothetical protein [Oculatellaceae cyanobacterium Prado106]